MKALRLSGFSLGVAEMVIVCCLASPDVGLTVSQQVPLSMPSSVRTLAAQANGGGKCKGCFSSGRRQDSRLRIDADLLSEVAASGNKQN